MAKSVKKVVAKKAAPAPKKQMFKVITVDTIKNVYYVEAECAEYAADTIACDEAEWDDSQQEFLNESIVSIEVSKDALYTVQGCDGPVYQKAPTLFPKTK
jgi:hypothetical protein